MPTFSSNRTVSPGKQRMMSNIKGATHQEYGKVASKSRAVRNHAYGNEAHYEPSMGRKVSSNLSTEQYPSNQVLPAVNDYSNTL